MKSFAYFKIIRPLNCLFATLTTFIGFWYLKDAIVTPVSNRLIELGLLPAYMIETDFTIFFACISTFLIAAGGYAINDFFDFEIDKINRPDRPLPQGKISLKQAQRYSMILFIFGVVGALFIINAYCIIIAFINVASLYLYARDFKKSFLFGNILVAWNACSTFVYGALVSSNIHNVLPLICFSFFFTIIREWVKTIEDFEGDFKENVRSIAVVCGIKKTANLLYIPFFILAFSVFILNRMDYISDILFATLHIVFTIPIAGSLFSLGRSLKKTVDTDTSIRPDQNNEHTGSLAQNDSNVNESIFVLNNKDIANIAKIQKFMKFNMLMIVLVFVINGILKMKI